MFHFITVIVVLFSFINYCMLYLLSTAFNDARGHCIERENYLDDLLGRSLQW